MNFTEYLFSESKNLSGNFLTGSGEQVTFSDLYLKSSRLACYLRSEYGQGNKILLQSPNKLYFIISYLGIMQSGNTVVPVNPLLEQENLDYIIRVCEMKVAFVSETIKNIKANVDQIVGEKALNEILEKTYPEVSFHSDDADDAEIIFTSGSTGDPKGVVLSHKNLIANTSSIISYLGLTSSDRVLIVLPFYYCYGLSLLHTHLKAGGSIVLNNSFIFLGAIIRDLNLYQCTGFAGVPSHYQILLRKTKSFTTTEFPSLRYVTQAGGRLAPVFIKEFTEAFPQISFFVMYGQTEATARLSYLPPAMLRNKLGSIGKGIPGVQLRVTDENGNDIGPGETGEIIASGDNIMKGYYLDNELTSQTIRNGWLYTGDIATIDEDGYIFIQSRKKEFIKSGGKRISIKEIEEALLQHPAVVDCTISGVEDMLLGEAIKASIVLNGDAKHTTEQEILEHCSKFLSLDKIPRIIEFEQQLILSATGKKLKKNNV